MTMAALTLRLRLSSPCSISRSRSPSPLSLSWVPPPSSSAVPLNLNLQLPLVPRASASDDLGRQIDLEPELETQLGGGGGGDKGSTGGNGDGGEGDEFEEEGMLMSQKFTLAYAALVGVGGLMGFVKKGSMKSAAAGGFSSLLLLYVYTQLPTNPTFASSLGLGISGALLAVMGSRFKNSGKIFPAGVVSLVSLFMTGGYLHAILRH
ncbi:hypothetical protein LUZ61_008348 [Rhynchospora tenuis]|uniref:Uncharacterized protein n=1 Tax=Rhynchospora tenuis TaxID=198213 RepID=A0AAD5ZVC6_9POAL|nr:hypothetical protein LUZ61_008348 [Rhynchospora tenuis]